MNEKTNEKNMSIFTVGHSNHSLEKLIYLLRDNEINLLIDVRSSPYSKYTIHFNGGGLKKSLTDLGIEYKFMGKELGGLPDDDAFYDDTGRVLYFHIAESNEFKKGISEIVKVIPSRRIVLLCAEENPAECHRRLLIGRVLFELGIKVSHIRADGSIQTEENLRREEEAASKQLSLFEEEEEDRWKSTRSVSPKRQQRNFSKR